MTTSIYPLTLFVDDHCALCRAEMLHLQQRDSQAQLRFVPLSTCAPERLPAGVTLADALSLMHAQQADGRWLRGVDVFRLAYAAVGWDTVARLLRQPIIARLAQALYPWLIRYRHHIPHWVVGLVFGRAIEQAAQHATTQNCTAQACALSPQPLKGEPS